MVAIESFSYPFFIQGQQLKSQDLNDIPSYVDIQDRLTRAQLIGTGIMDGLDVHWDDAATAKKLVIGKGVGISSKGHLFYLPETVEFTHYVAASLPGSYFFEDTSNAGANYDVWRLTGAVTDAKSLTEFFPIADGCDEDRCNKCLLALRVMKPTNGSEGCFNGLETVSKKINFEIAYYLVDATLLGKLEPLLPSGERKIRLDDLPLPFLQRPGFDAASTDLASNVNLTSIVDSSTFISAFFGVCESGINSLVAAFSALQERAGKALDPALKFNTLKENLTATLEICREGSGYKLPYFYEFLEDLVKTCNELVSLGAVTLPYPPVEVQENWFPNHLLLGGYGSLASSCRTPKYCKTHCACPPSGNVEKARCLYLRLGSLLRNRAFGEMPTKPKITPSKGYDHAPGWRAIPFYYKPEVRADWNCKLSGQGKSHLIPSYFPGSTNEPFADPLLHELESWGFFRVEGHANLALKEALEKIKAEQKRLNVAFDIVPVRLSGATSAPPSTEVSEDLERAFHQLRLEWILDIQHVTAAKDLLKFLEDMKDKHLHELDLPTLRDLANATGSKEDVCKYKVVAHLVDKRSKRVEPPVFSQFAERHPGLEHLGGVQPGGTLALVYYEEGTTGQTNPQQVREQRVIADFCLPYLCCVKPQEEAPSEIFACFPGGQLQSCEEPKEIFTWPAGGRVLVSVKNGATPAVDIPIPAASLISPQNGRWQFAPARLPETVFGTADGLANVQLQFMNLGKTIEVQTLAVFQLRAMFALSTAWLRDEGAPDVLQALITDVKPNDSSTYKWQWRLDWLLRETAVEDTVLPGGASSTVNPPWQGLVTFAGTTLPTHVRVRLTVTNSFGCSATLVQEAAFIVPEADDGDIGDGNIGDNPVNPVSPVNRSAKPSNRGGKGASGKPDKSQAAPPDSGAPVSDSARHLDLEEILHRRLDRYKKRLVALEMEDDGANSDALHRASLFFVLPPNRTTTSLRYREFAERLLENFSALAPVAQALRRQLIGVLTHDFLDKLFALGETRFDASTLPNRTALEQNGVDIGGLLAHWHGEEIGVGMSVGSRG